MRTRIEVTFTAGTRSINTGITDLTIEDIRLIANETTGQPICYTGAKGNIASVVNGVVTYNESMTDEDGETELFPPLAEGDKITFEIDQGKIEQVLIPMTSAEVTEMVEEIIAEES